MAVSLDNSHIYQQWAKRTPYSPEELQRAEDLLTETYKVPRDVVVLYVEVARKTADLLNISLYVASDALGRISETATRDP